MKLLCREETGIWEYEFSVRGCKFRGTCKSMNEIEARKVAQAIYANALKATPTVDSRNRRMTLEKLTKQWLKTCVVSHSDWRNDESRVRKLFGIERRNGKNVEGARFGLPRDMYVDQLTQRLLSDLRDRRHTEGNSTATINREMALLQSLIGFARSLAVMTPATPIIWSHRRNKAASLKRNEPHGRLRYLSLDEEILLLKALRSRITGQHALAAQDAYDLVILLLDTGARHGEIARLTWNCIDLGKGTISLFRTKTQNESRLRMSMRVHEVLERRQKICGRRHHVFPAFDGSVWSIADKPRGHAMHAVQVVIDALGFNEPHLVTASGRVTAHTLRHTFASKMVEAGVSLYKVSRLLGHSTTLMTQRYAHLSDGGVAEEAVQVLDGIANTLPRMGVEAILRPRRAPSSITSDK